MAGDKARYAPQDAKLISLEADYQIDYWTEKFGVLRDRLTTTVRRVGRAARDLRRGLSARDSEQSLSSGRLSR
jgi:hypothetical protein